MNTPKICNLPRGLVLALLAAIPAASSGCGISQGMALYMLGIGRRSPVKAEYRLTKEPILILVDDFSGQLDWPPTAGYLMDELGEQLVKEGGATRVIPRRTLENLRRRTDRYDQLSAQQIGRKCGAEQVVWIEVDRFFGDTEFFEPTNAAYFAVTVKVLNVMERDNRSRVRVWPVGPRGHYVNVSLDGSEVSRLSTRDAIAKRLAVKVSEEITKLFTDHVPGDFED